MYILPSKREAQSDKWLTIDGINYNSKGCLKWWMLGTNGGIWKGCIYNWLITNIYNFIE